MGLVFSMADSIPYHLPFVARKNAGRADRTCPSRAGDALLRLPSERLSLGGGDHALFDLLVEVALERGRGLLAEDITLLLRAKPLLRPLARARHRLLRPGDRPLHGNRHAQLVNLSAALAKDEVRRDAPLLRFGED